MKTKPSNTDKPKCPECNSNDNVVKNGYSRNKPRWRCKSCKYDFTIKSLENLRKHNFEYLDLKILAICLYIAGVKVTEVFDFLVAGIDSNMKNERIIYKWAKRFKNFERNSKTKLKYKIRQLETTAEVFTIWKQANNIFQDYTKKAYFIYFSINGNADFSQSINIITNGIKNSESSYSNNEPLWFNLLIFSLINQSNRDRLFKLFDFNDTDCISKFEKLYRNYKTINYNYKNYFISAEEQEYFKIRQKFENKDDKCKDRNKENIILFTFDSTFDDLNVYIINESISDNKVL